MTKIRITKHLCFHLSFIDPLNGPKANMMPLGRRTPRLGGREREKEREGEMEKE